MVWCVGYGCKNRGKQREHRSVSFHRFPKDLALKKCWVAALKLKQLPERFATTGYACSDHFTEGDFKRNRRAKLFGSERVCDRWELVAGAVPSQFCFSPLVRKQPSKKREHARLRQTGRHDVMVFEHV